jgi:predicted adenylyl cyclase CyaB
MKNVELKIQVNNFKEIRSLLKSIQAKSVNRLNQVDTYYHYHKGRIKIRENNRLIFQLIYYERPDKNSSRVSNYEIIDIKPGQVKNLKTIFYKLLGEKAIIKKVRDLWIYKHTRIHLDKVEKLGNFLELETVVKNISLK